MRLYLQLESYIEIERVISIYILISPSTYITLSLSVYYLLPTYHTFFSTPQLRTATAAVPASGRPSCGVGYTHSVLPRGSQSYHDHCSSLHYHCHRQDSLAPGSAGSTKSHPTVTDVFSLLGLHRVGLGSEPCPAFQCKYTYV